MVMAVQAQVEGQAACEGQLMVRSLGDQNFNLTIKLRGRVSPYSNIGCTGFLWWLPMAASAV